MKFFYGSYEAIFVEYFVPPMDDEIFLRTDSNHSTASVLDGVSTRLLWSGFDQEDKDELALVQKSRPYVV